MSLPFKGLGMSRSRKQSHNTITQHAWFWSGETESAHTQSSWFSLAKACAMLFSIEVAKKKKNDFPSLYF